MRLLHLAAVSALAVAVITTGTVSPVLATEAEGPAAVQHLPPVDAPLADTFRPPASPYGAGNRGVDYATGPGQPVVASAAGQVVFAGRIGLGLHVVVLHADGIRTSYSFLHGIDVERGQRVAAGQQVGTAGRSLHFGARAGDAYVDPLVLLGQRPGTRVWLVRDDLRVPLDEAGERSLLARALAGATAVVTEVAPAAVGWAARRAGSAALAATPTAMARARLDPVLSAVGEWWAARAGCTPASAPVAPLDQRRLAVLVGGLGSASGHAAILDVDTGALGYAPADVTQFSYRGGTTADTSYEAADTQVDIRASGRRLRELLDRLAAEHPGVPIDVLAHSQGGLVTRSALGDAAPPAVRTVVTLATPHRGADLATFGAALYRGPVGRGLLMAAAGARPLGLDPTSTSIGQLAETSELVAELRAQPLPPGPRYVSIAARFDAVVTTPQTRLQGAEHAVVGVPWSANAHDALPGSPEATRQLALAVTGQPLGCRGLPSRMVDLGAGHAISRAVDFAAGNDLAPARPPA